MPNQPQDYDQEHIKLAKARTKDLKAFFEHLGSYLIVNTTLFSIDWLSGGGWWFHWPLLGWGVGLAFHGMSVFVKSPINRYVARVERRELRRIIREQKHSHTFREHNLANRQQQAILRQRPFAKKLEKLIGSDALKDLGQELSSAMRELETELGEFGLGWTNTSKKAKPEAAPKIPQGVAILMFTDMEGFTAYNERHGDEAGLTLLKLHHHIVRESVARNDGVEVKNLGDGFMLCFASAKKALRCAADIQAKLREDDFPLQVRIGLHAGEPIQEGQDLTGQTVNVASRVMDQANGGQILVTEVVKNLAGPLKGYQYVDQGQRRLPGLSQAQQLFEYHPIHALNDPLDSEVDHRLKVMEQQLKNE